MVTCPNLLCPLAYSDLFTLCYHFHLSYLCALLHNFLFSLVLMPAFYDCLIYIFLHIGVSWGVLDVWWCVSLNWLVLIMVILFGVVVWFWWILVI